MMTHPLSRQTGLLVALLATFACVSTARADPCANSTAFRIGAGIYDITGPPAEVGMMGYAMPQQRTQGLHTRLWSRAFVFESFCNGKRVAFVSADLGLLTQAVKTEVVRLLKQRFGNVYGDANVMISATHTHSGPGGYSHYLLYNLTVLGFSEQNFRVVADGIAESIARADANLADGRLTIATGDLLDASINRSIDAYLQNPAEERVRYSHDTDKLMTLLKLTDAQGTEIGMVNWFAVHATSMGNRHFLISGDNKGYASSAFERWKRADYSAAKTFVAAFAQSNEGDTSPNVFGGEDGGGPDDFESTRLSGEKQFAKARELYEQAHTPITGAIDFRHAFVKMDALTVQAERADGRPQSTCPAAIGLSMLAGTEDGRGVGREGLACRAGTPQWFQQICRFLTTPCQAEKPIVLEMGTMKPYPWTPEVLPAQIMRIGQLAIVGVPFELTTMAGRRLRETVHAALRGAGVEHVVVAGLANAYAGYITTREEYAIQHYEGASTHFGPWTLAALQQEFEKLAVAMRDHREVDPGPTPRDLSKAQGTLIEPVLFDSVPDGERFGQILTDAEPLYRAGHIVRVTFRAGNPNNNLKTQGSYLYVERKLDDGIWQVTALDYDWETKFLWEREYCLPDFMCSRATVEWTIPPEVVPGTYRIRHEGHWKSKEEGLVKAYSGTSREFVIEP